MPNNWEKIRKLRNKSISNLREAKKEYKIKLSEKIHQRNFRAKLGKKLLFFLG